MSLAWCVEFVGVQPLVVGCWPGPDGVGCLNLFGVFACGALWDSVSCLEIERELQECIDARLVEAYKKGDYPHHCSPCFLVAEREWIALRLVVDYRKCNKQTQKHSGVLLTWRKPLSTLPNAGIRRKSTSAVVPCRLT